VAGVTTMIDSDGNNEARAKSMARLSPANPYFGGGKSDFAMQLKWNLDAETESEVEVERKDDE
jgi:hypothetical protein